MRIAIGFLACTVALHAGAASAAPGRAPAPATECRRLPAGKRLVRLSLKPNTEIPDLVAWIASVTCKQFVLPGGVASGKTVTIVSPQLITVGEAYDLFVSALDTVGLTVYPSGQFLRVIEVGKAKTSPVPLVITPG
jgi:general secretion pathway protein D